MIGALQNNLKLGVDLLRALSEAQYQDTSVGPYHASIGNHIRHILDMFDCVFSGLNSGAIDLTARKRDENIEQDISAALVYFKRTLDQLTALRGMDMCKIVSVTDDLGMGVERADYTLAAILIQTHSHATHHYASIGHILCQIGVDVPDNVFGYNPTTPCIMSKT